MTHPGDITPPSPHEETTMKPWQWLTLFTVLLAYLAVPAVVGIWTTRCPERPCVNSGDCAP